MVKISELVSTEIL